MIQNDPIIDAIHQDVGTVSEGSVITAYIMVVNYLDGDGDESWGYRTMEGQSELTSAGLVRLIDESVGRGIRRTLGDT